MKFKFSFFLLIFCLPGFAGGIRAKNIQVKKYLTGETLVLDESVDFHLTDASEPLRNSTVNLLSEDAWLFFDRLKPSEVLKRYGSSVFIGGEAFDPGEGGNARLGIYGQGAVIIPYPSGYKPLQTFTKPHFGGESEKYAPDHYYTNAPVPDMPSEMVCPLKLDNRIRSFRLKRGYMATLANEPDGLGYSRVYIADREDLLVPVLPELSDRKISYIRVFRWQWVSKKGWVGSYDKNQPDGLKYVEEQCGKTNSTWFYNWGASADGTRNPAAEGPNYDQEFCPEKWGAGGSWSQLFASRGTSHLLGYNEPDHTEQSNVTVETAIEEWPKMLQAGMRLGSPATTDFNWLYRFMDECRKRNYRVDYVVVHAYWGGKSASDWYKDLKAVHERTGRPVWIKEWNNGANWTKEPWPSGTEAQQQKQLTDLKGILQVMDTAGFIERYSIYNWVEDKRALLLNGNLTPAGAYYADNSPGIAYNNRYEVIPGWTCRDAAVLSYNYSPQTGCIRLTWTDGNKELVSGFTLEKSLGNEDFRKIASIGNSFITEYCDPLQVDTEAVAAGYVSYRVKSEPYDGGNYNVSNVVRYDVMNNKNSGLSVGNLIVRENWSSCFWANLYAHEPVMILGAPTNRNKMPLVSRIKNFSGRFFDFRLGAWEYLQHPSFLHPDTVALLALPAGRYDFDGITAEAGKVSGVNREWKPVRFTGVFTSDPVIFVSRITNNCDTTASVRIRKVTSGGFEVKLQYEQAITSAVDDEEIHFLAVTPGTGHIDGQTIQVGRATEGAGGFYHSCRIEFGRTYEKPAFFGCMQTESDGIAAALRIRKRGAGYTEVFKERENSLSADGVTEETVGWMVMETDVLSAVKDITRPAGNIIYNPGSHEISLGGFLPMSQAEVYTAAGEKVLSAGGVCKLNVTNLTRGLYIARIQGIGSLKFVKP